MPKIRIPLDHETYECLTHSAVQELRPIAWQVVVLLRQALGLPFPYPRDEPPSVHTTPAQGAWERGHTEGGAGE